jgi:transcriptional regulator with XRE-family HTH domain
VTKEYLSVKDVVKTYRSKMGLSQVELAASLVNGILNKKLSRQAVSNWELGIDEPEVTFLLQCMAVHDDWRRQFAADCLCAILPELFQRVDGSIQILI